MANPTGANQVLTKIYETANNAIRVNDISGGGYSSVATNPTIINISVPSSNTELSYSLPTDTKRFIMRSRIGSKIQLSYISGESNVEFITINAGCVYEETGIITNSTLYFQTNKSSDTIEILSWS